MKPKAIYKNNSDNQEHLKRVLGNSLDVIYRLFNISAFRNSEAMLVYIKTLIDDQTISQQILKPLISDMPPANERSFIKRFDYIAWITEKGIFAANVQRLNSWQEVLDYLLSGNSLLFINGCSDCLAIYTKTNESRDLQEPSTESEVRGSRDGFVENIEKNIMLIRNRIKESGLRFENMVIGKKTKTSVVLVYIKNLVDEALLKEVRTRLERISIDGVLESAYLEELIEDAPLSPFKQIKNTERPDKACSAILEGRIVILTDNTPTALLVPTMFWEILQSPGDYYERYYVATFIRWIRIIALFISTSISSMYIMLTAYHQEMIPTALAMHIAAGRENVPFPAVVEALFMEIVFEVLKESGLRMPRPIGNAVSIVGALVIGEAAVRAGLIGDIMVITIALSSIASFALPAYGMINSIRLLRFPLIMLTAMLGLFGYLAGIMAIVLHLLSLRSFGVPFLAPINPLNKSMIKDIFIRSPWWAMFTRPSDYNVSDINRQSPNNAIPRPPQKNSALKDAESRRKPTKKKVGGG